MKKGIIFLMTIILLFSTIIGIISNLDSKNKSNTDKIKIVATLFPQYDFAKQIGKDKVEVSLLLTPGTETHTYEPTPQDILNVNNADLFIYTGKYMEPWSDKIASSITTKTVILDASQNIDLIKNIDDEGDHSHHDHGYDPHIWLNPQNAIIMVKNITEQLCNIDSDNSEFYKENSNKYIKEIEKIDNRIKETIQNAKKNKIAFGGTFAYAYFVNEYNIEYKSAYDSCGEDSEPSVSKVKDVIDYMNENDIHVIFYQELSSGKIADAIAEETNSKKLIFHTIHNASQEEIDKGETYISLMNKNINNLNEALN